MKRAFYIFAFTVLGVLLQFIVHAVVEIRVIDLLVSDFGRYGLGLTWRQWYLIHHVATVALFLAGAAFGYFSGVHWWRIIYVERRYPWKFPKKEKTA